MSISDALGREIASALTQADGGKERRKIVRDYARSVGHTEQYLYAMAKKHGWSSGREKKSTAGERKIQLGDKELKLLAKIVDTCRVKGKAPLSTWRTIQIAENSGYIPRGVLTESFFNQWFKEQKYSRKEKDARSRKNHIQLRSLHPNHVHLSDITNCTQWYLKKDKTLGHQTPKELNRNKEGKNPKGPKILRFMLVDHYSGAFFPYYFMTDGEGAVETRDFLIKAWRLKADPERFPFHGVPQILMGDKGPGNESTLIQEFLSSLGVRWISHETGKPWVKGMVEGMMPFWERNFEACLRLDPAFSVEDLNVRAYDLAALISSTRIHKRHGGTRFGAWNQIKKEELRVLPEDGVLSGLVQTRAFERVVGPDLMIRMDNKVYRMPDPDLNGAKVQVCFDPYNTQDLLVTAGKQHFRLSAIAKVDGQFLETSPIIGEEFKTVAQPSGSKAQAALAKEDWPAQPKVFGEGFNNVGNVGYIIRQGTPIDLVPLIREVPRISAMAQIRTGLGRGLTAEENSYIHDRFEHTVPEPEIKKMVDMFRGGLSTEGAIESMAAG